MVIWNPAALFFTEGAFFIPKTKLKNQENAIFHTGRGGDRKTFSRVKYRTRRGSGPESAQFCTPSRERQAPSSHSAWNREVLDALFAPSWAACSLELVKGNRTPRDTTGEELTMRTNHKKVVRYCSLCRRVCDALCGVGASYCVGA